MVAKLSEQAEAARQRGKRIGEATALGVLFLQPKSTAVDGGIIKMAPIFRWEIKVDGNVMVIL